LKPILLRLIIVLLLVATVFIIALNIQKEGMIDDITGQLLIAANEMQNGDESAQGHYAELKEDLKAAAKGQNAILLAMWLSIGVCVAFSLYLYVSILRPFHQLEKFALNIAAGDYDRPLDMPRHNVFGTFSWAFDSMREGLHSAQKSEEEARNANKLLIATISHDIKTPIASIRACAEGLSSGQATNEERRQRYLDTILRRSDEVANLTDDLFLHAIADMDKLAMDPKSISLRRFFAEFMASIQIGLAEDIPDINVLADEKRLAEIFGNIIHNSEKYAPETPCELSFMQENDLVYCIFSDKGQSLSPDDAPFIFEKFYRGKNVGNEQGSGLGLYIVRYIAEKLGGKAHSEWTADGLKIFVGLKAVS
jgi:signal transduction histidine kinase